MASETERRIEKMIVDSAEGPKQVQGAAGMVTQRSMSELIAVDRYLASKKALKKKGGIGLKFFKLRPGNCE